MASKTKDMRLSDSAQRYVAFAQFCIEHELDPSDVAKLVTLAERSFKAGERYCNTGSEWDSVANERSGERVEKAAEALGFKVTWPGLWPRLQKDGRDVTLPLFKS